ncbi:MAG TPA: hypothetical protein VFX70_09915, partial [Mycobacteriales bacterium]|nr:hypothetical protein [Mycobacteriales bacterium]
MPRPDEPQGERAVVPAPKVRVPVQRCSLVPRERLLGMVDPDPPDGDATGSHLTLVCGPAGSGKTTLLSSLVGRLRASRPGGTGASPVAWVSLDSDDNDPYLLWSAILAALELTGAWSRGGTLAQLSPPRGAMEPGFLSAVVAAFE